MAARYRIIYEGTAPDVVLKTGFLTDNGDGTWSLSDSLRVLKAGDTMTGNLIISGAKLGVQNATPDAMLHVGTGDLAISGNVAFRVEPIWTSSPGSYDRAFLFQPTFNHNVGANAIGMQVLPKLSTGKTCPILFGIAVSPYSDGTTTTWYGLYIYPNSGAGTITNKYDAAFVGGGAVGFNTDTPTAWVHIAAGSAGVGKAPFKLTAGTNLTTPENGAIEFDGTNAFLTTGGVRRKLKPQFTTLAKSAAYNANAWEFILATTGAAWALNLPSAVTAGDGAEVSVKKISNDANAVTFTATAGVVELGLGPTLVAQGQAYTFRSNGTDWFIA